MSKIRNFGVKEYLTDFSQKYLNITDALNSKGYTYVGTLSTIYARTRQPMERLIFKAPDGKLWGYSEAGIGEKDHLIKSVAMTLFLGDPAKLTT